MGGCAVILPSLPRAGTPGLGRPILSLALLFTRYAVVVFVFDTGVHVVQAGIELATLNFSPSCSLPQSAGTTDILHHALLSCEVLVRCLILLSFDFFTYKDYITLSSTFENCEDYTRYWKRNSMVQACNPRTSRG